MKFMVRQAFESRRFVVGFAILMITLFIVFVYPLFVRTPPLEIIGQGTFFPPGIYVNTYDSVNSPTTYTLDLDNAATRRIASRLTEENRTAMKEWLVADGIAESEIDVADTEKLLALWESHYDPNRQVKGMTLARQRYFQRVNASIAGLLSEEGVVLAAKTPIPVHWRKKGPSVNPITSTSDRLPTSVCCRLEPIISAETCCRS